MAGRRRPSRPTEIALAEHAREGFLGGVGGTLDTPRPVAKCDAAADSVIRGKTVLFYTEEWEITAETPGNWFFTLTYYPLVPSEHVYIHTAADGTDGRYLDTTPGYGLIMVYGSSAQIVYDPVGYWSGYPTVNEVNPRVGDFIVVSYAYDPARPYVQPPEET